jgi:hypothetical protein
VPCPPPYSEEDSETECLLEEVIDDGLDDDDPFFLVERLVVFFHMVAALTQIYIHGFQLVTRYTNIFFGVWTLSGIRMCFVGRNKLRVAG